MTVLFLQKAAGAAGGKSVLKERKTEQEGSEGSAGELFGEAANFHKPGKCT